MTPTSSLSRLSRPLLLSLATFTAAGALSGCGALLLGGAVVGGALVATDRRTSGTQLEDQSIELKSGSRVREAIGDRGHVNVTSYSRLVLLTGEVASEADKAAVQQHVARIENVRNVINELEIAPASSLGSRSNDTILTSKVKASLVDAKDLHANAFKLVTERGVVYLMGRVTEREAARAADIATRVSGVNKVVRVVEVLTEAELAGTNPLPAPAK